MFLSSRIATRLWVVAALSSHQLGGGGMLLYRSPVSERLDRLRRCGAVTAVPLKASCASASFALDTASDSVLSSLARPFLSVLLIKK